MDNFSSTSESFCTSYIYSENVINYLIKYDNDLTRVYSQVQPDCVNIINDFFLVAYKNLPQNESYINSTYQYGYSYVPKCYGLMDISAVNDTGVSRIKNLPGLNLSGRGTIIGFIDTGIDYTNPLFRKTDGTTRLKAIWDQNEAAYGTAPAVFGYGGEYSEEMINEALNTSNPFEIVPQRDENGHGTFMASIAAGGNDPSEPFTGIATEADILAVKLKPAKTILREVNLINSASECYSEDDIIFGIKYLIDTATKLNKPLIIYLGIGTNQGDHSGTNNLDLYIDTFVSLRGICIVAPVGNELGYRRHYSGGIINPEQSSPESIEISVESPAKGFTMEIWGSAPALLEVNVVSPTGEIFDDISFVRDSMSSWRFLYEGTDLFILNTVIATNKGDQIILLRFENPSQGIWTVNVKNLLTITENVFDAWLPINQFTDGKVNFVRSNPDMTLCSPGAGNGVITVAGYNHYTGALYTYSSRGYTRKGRIKPDITAPSVNVQGAFSTSSGLGNRLLYTKKSGTSVGAALVAGIASLIMEWGIVKGNAINANTETIKQFLIRGARDEADIDYPNNAWGWGVVDIYNSFETIRDRT